MPMRLTLEERDARHAAHFSARTIATTPAHIAFLERPDVRVLRFPSGAFHLFVGNRPFVGDTLLVAVEAARKECDP